MTHTAIQDINISSSEAYGLEALICQYHCIPCGSVLAHFGWSAFDCLNQAVFNLIVSVKQTKSCDSCDSSLLKNIYNIDCNIIYLLEEFIEQSPSETYIINKLEQIFLNNWACMCTEDRCEMLQLIKEQFEDDNDIYNMPSHKDLTTLVMHELNCL